MKSFILLGLLLSFFPLVSFSQEQTDASLKSKKLKMDFRKSTREDIEALKKEGITRRLSGTYYLVGSRMFFLNGKPIDRFAAPEILKANTEAYQLYSDGIKRLGKVKKWEHAVEIYGTAWLITSILVNVSQVNSENYDNYDKNNILIGVLAIPIIGIIAGGFGARSAGINTIEKSIEVYNRGGRTTYNSQNAELKLGFIGNGFGLRINF